MAELKTKNFHIMERIEPAQKQRCFVLGYWRPKKIRLIGCQFGLLCEEGNGVEIYICVSYNDSHDSQDNFKTLKTNYLFYAQRDAYLQPAGIDDILSFQMLPQGEYFKVSKDHPIYVKVGVVSPNSTQKYDAFVNLYYK